MPKTTPPRRQGYAATVGQPQGPATVLPETYYTLATGILQYEQAIAAAKALGIPTEQAETELARMKASFAATPKPASPWGN